MTNEEAIRILEGDIHCDVPKSAVLANKHNQAVLKAIEALEKQIPKEQEEMREDEYGVDWVCPTCERFHRTEWKMAFCSSCGQAIDGV